MKTSVKSFSFSSKFNLNHEIALCTLQEKLSAKHLVSFTTPHLLDFYALILVTEGEYRHVLDFQEYHLKVGDLFLICPNQIHYFVDLVGFDGYIIFFPELFLKEYFISFSPMIRYKLLYEFYVIKKITLDDFAQEQFIGIYRLLFNELKREYDSNQKTILQNLLSVVLHNICREFNKENSVSRIELDKTFIDFKQLLMSKTNYKFNVQYYADSLNINVRTLQNVVKNNTNRTPKELIDDNLILECKRKLLNSDSLIQGAAFELGFDDPSAFSKFFKRYTGLTPYEFKKKYAI